MILKKLIILTLNKLGYEIRKIPKRKKLVVIGCGRSGTGFSTRLFQELGLDIKHEEMGKDGTSSWPATLWNHLPQEFEHIFHQVREPLNAISSIQTFVEGSWRFIGRQNFFKLTDDKILNSANYWYHWNLLAETRTDFRYRVEDIFDLLPLICSELGMEYKDLSYLKEKGINSRKGTFDKLTWGTIKEKNEALYNKIYNMALRYGYSY